MCPVVWWGLGRPLALEESAVSDLLDSLLLTVGMRTSTYSDEEPGPRTPTLTTTTSPVEYLNADPVDYVNESAPTRWIT